MPLRLILIVLSAVAWFWLLHVHLTLPAPVVIGIVVWAVLMTVIAAALWWRARRSPERN